MEEGFPESPLAAGLQTSTTEAIQDPNVEDQHRQNPDDVKRDLEQESQDQVRDPDKDGPADPRLELQGEPTVDLKPTGASEDEPGPPPVDRRRSTGSVWDQDPSQDHRRDVDGESSAAAAVDQDSHLDRDQHPATNQDADGESGDGGGGGVPALVITQAEEARRPPSVGPAEPRRPQRPADLVIPSSASDLSLSPGSDGGDMACCDLLSPRSDSVSLASELTASRTSEDDDIRSVTASSVMSLFHRVQLDPLEKHWWRSSAVGNMAAQRLLLCQEPGLLLKKTALHWAAKQGRQEAVDMMLRSGADVNVRSGYTALHLASIHGHRHIVHSLISTYNAKTNIRDYHGKTAVHYWSGCRDVFNKPDSQPGGRFSRGRWTQRYALPSLLLSRSRSQAQLSLDFGTPPPSHDAFDLRV